MRAIWRGACGSWPKWPSCRCFCRTRRFAKKRCRGSPKKPRRSGRENSIRGRLTRPRRWRFIGARIEIVQKSFDGSRDFVKRRIESLLIGPRWFAESTDFPDELQCGGGDFLARRGFAG